MFARIRSAFLCLPACLLACLTTGMAEAQELDGLAVAQALEGVFVKAIERAEPSVVSIARIKPSPPRNLIEERRNTIFPQNAENPDNPDFVPSDFGAGIILGADGPNAPRPRKGYILTNYHVVRGGAVEGEPQRADTTQLHVRLHDRRGFWAKIYAADPRSDLAVLTIDETDIPAIPMVSAEDADKVRKGQFVIALGNPYAIARDGSASVSWGMISNISRRPAQPPPETGGGTSKAETIHHLGNLLQVDTRLNLGTSGGALVNMRGELIGITTSLAALDGYEKSVGYAVPIDRATLRIIETLKRGMEVEYGFLGVNLSRSDIPMSDLFRGERAISGAQVLVVPNSPAAMGGIQAGDYIQGVNGIPIRNRVDLTREIAKIAPGEEVSIQIQRPPFQKLTLKVELGKWPVLDEEGIIVQRHHYEPWRGLVVDFPTGRMFAVDRSMTAYPRAVLVTEVIANSRAALADLTPGTFITRVNGKPVFTPESFHRAVTKIQNADATLDLLDGTRVLVRSP